MRNLFIITATIACCASAQHNLPVGSCGELSALILRITEKGDLATANEILRAPTPSQAKVLDARCAGAIQVDMAVVLQSQGDATAAERMANASIKTLENAYSSDDEILIRPLHRLALARCEEGHFAQARETLQRMRLIAVKTPLGRALIASISASLLQVEGRWKEAEMDYLEALAATVEAGNEASADFGSGLNALAILYTQQGRFEEASRMSDRALIVFQTAKDATPSDTVKLLHLRSVLYARQKQWRAAEDVGEEAISLAERIDPKNPVWMRSLLENYAIILRKNHKKQQAQGIEARIAALGMIRGGPGTVVDVVELATAKALRR